MDAFPAIEEIIKEWPDDSGAQKALLKLPFFLLEYYTYIIWKKEEESLIAFMLCLVRAKSKRPEYIFPITPDVLRNLSANKIHVHI